MDPYNNFSYVNVAPTSVPAALHNSRSLYNKSQYDLLYSTSYDYANNAYDYTNDVNTRQLVPPEPTPKKSYEQTYNDNYNAHYGQGYNQSYGNNHNFNNEYRNTDNFNNYNGAYGNTYYSGFSGYGGDFTQSKEYDQYYGISCAAEQNQHASFNTTSEISPYFGIEKNWASSDEYTEQQNYNDKEGNIENSLGAWKPTNEDLLEKEVENLTHDASIIAGVAFEEYKSKSTSVDSIDSFEIKVPAEMLTDTKCYLCNIEITSFDMGQLHYSGKKHAQKENQYIRNIYEQKGINITRFLPKARPKVDNQDKKKEDCKKKFMFTCRLCGLSFENQQQVDEHVLKPGHRSKMMQRQDRYMGPSGHFRSGTAAFIGGKRRRFDDESPKEYSDSGMIVCSLCSKEMNSEQQWELHAQSKKHTRKVEEGY